ncbi:ApeP family dehydratase [Arenimonas alkanexedens]
MDVRDEAIERLLPHRGGMLWIDRVLQVDAENVVAEATVRDDHLLLGDSGDAVPAWVGIEYMAQAIAAWAGARALARDEAVKPGFLLGSRRYEAHWHQLPVGSLLRIEAHCELMGENGLGLFACRLLVGEAIVATASVSVFEPPDPDAYLGTTPA